MNISPAVTNKLEFNYLEYTIDLELNYNLTFISDVSGTGKTYLYEIINKQRTCKSLKDLIIKCYNYCDKELVEKEKKLTNDINGSTDTLFIIDNADILLSDDDRIHIAFDTKNQYILIGRKVEGLMLCDYNCASVVIDNKAKRITLEYED